MMQTDYAVLLDDVFFILGCNLMGMIPFVGSPTASFGTTFALALLVFILGVAMGIKTLG